MIANERKKQATGEKVSELKPAGKEKAPCFNVPARANHA